MTTRKEIVDALIAILEAHADTLGVEWHKGQPARGRWNKYPFGWVEWMGGRVEPKTAVAERHLPNLFIVVVDQSVDEDVAEDSVMDYADKIEALMKSNTAISGTAETCWFVFDEKEKSFSQDDRSIAGVRLTLTVMYSK